MSQRLPGVKPRQLLSFLERQGFFVHHTTGSHYVLRHPTKRGVRVVVPYHSQDLKRKTLASIIEAAGYTAKEFLDLL